MNHAHLSGYVPTSQEDEVLLTWTSGQNLVSKCYSYDVVHTRPHLLQVYRDYINVVLPQDLIWAENLASVVPRDNAAEADGVIGHLALWVVGLAIMLSLYVRCQDLFA